MLGFADFWVFAGYACAILAALLCVVYGLANWNEPKEIKEETAKDLRWKKKDSEINQ